MRSFLNYYSLCSFSAWYTPRPEWSAVRYEPVMLPDFMGLSNVHVTNATHAHFQFINSNSREVIDDFWISKTRE